MVVMVIGAIVSGFNKGVADMLEQSGPKTFWVGRFFSGGVNISDGSDEMSPWRHNPPISLADAQTIARLPRVSWVALDEGGQADVTFGAKTQHSVRIFGRSAADRKSTRLNSSHSQISYAVFCLKKKKINGKSA